MAARAAAAWFLLKRRLGWRALLRLTPLEAGLVRGTHGRTALAPGLEPVLVAEGSFVPDDMWVPLRGVHDVILRHLSGEPA
jgi:hypothetical protein